MRHATAKKVVRRRKLREQLGLDEDEQVVTTWAGPPQLDTDDRRRTMRSCRRLLEEDGFEISRAQREAVPIKLFRRSHRGELTGTQAQDALVNDEELADAGEHWWLHSAVWTATSPPRTVYAGVEPDGNDIEWIGWGDASVAETIRRIETLLLAGDADLVAPYFAFSDDVESFDSLGALLDHIEPWDVTTELEVFDATGRHLRLRAVGVVRTRRTVSGGWTIIDRQAPPPTERARLMALLRERARALPPTADASSELDLMGLPELVALVHPRSRRG